MTQDNKKPKSQIEKRIYSLTFELHKDGHSRKEIVHFLREVADNYEDHFGDSDSWNLSPSEKNIVTPGDFEE